MLEAQTIGFRFGLLSLFKSSLEIGSVVVEEGQLRVLIDTQGKGNYDILKPGEEEDSSSEDPNINLTSAELRQIAIFYTEQSQNQQLEGTVQSALFSGAFSNTAFELESNDQDSQALLPGFLNGTFDANIEVLNYQKIEEEDFQGKLAFRGNIMNVLGEIKAYGG